MTQNFLNQKNWHTALRAVSNYYGVGVMNICGMDGVTDDPARFTEDDLQWSGNRYYKEQYEKQFPVFMQNFDTINDDWMPDFELWDWDYGANRLRLVRERTKKS
jgi:hypothetical protein